MAKAAGVSKTAVSFAFNQPDQLSTATRDRVMAAASRLGYSPHPAALSLSTKRSGSVGLLVPQPLAVLFANPFVSELIQGIGDVCAERELNLLLVPPLNGSLAAAVARAHVDGVITLGLSARDETWESLQRLHIPCIVVDAEAPPDTLAVHIDDFAGAVTAAEHVLSLGHSSIAIVDLGEPRLGLGRSGIGSRRAAGYRKAIRSGGAPPPRFIRAGPTFAAGRAAFRQLWRAGMRPTAILAMSDMAAIGLMAEARVTGLRLPDDLSVVGYDDIPMATWVTPTLTTVRQPIAEKGRIAARLLIARLEGDSVKSPAALHTQLVVRESTAPASH